jgi:hypothetical protein
MSKNIVFSFTDIEAENNIEGRRTNQHDNYWTTETRGLYLYIYIYLLILTYNGYILF